MLRDLQVNTGTGSSGTSLCLALASSLSKAHIAFQYVNEHDTADSAGANALQTEGGATGLCIPASELQRLFDQSRDRSFKQRVMQLGMLRYTAVTGLLLGVLLVPRLLVGSS